MDAPTAADSICSHQLDALKLRVVNHKYAARIAKHALPVWRHAKALIKLHVQIQTEAVALAAKVQGTLGSPAGAGYG